MQKGNDGNAWLAKQTRNNRQYITGMVYNIKIRMGSNEKQEYMVMYNGLVGCAK